MNIELGEVQAAFADIIWTNELVESGELVKICERELKWKKPTTYTVLRKLCEKGLFKNEDGVVTSVISRVLQNIRPYIVCGENWLDKQPERSE